MTIDIIAFITITISIIIMIVIINMLIINTNKTVKFISGDTVASLGFPRDPSGVLMDPIWGFPWEQRGAL